MKDSQYIQDYKEAVLAMKAFEENNEEFNGLMGRLQRLHFQVFYPDDVNKEVKLKQAHEMNEWLKKIDFEYF
ncbi:hypothetical protein IID19_03960 [Patescibacteria group bacterium]|nr:hypothetical protein [Patescibacteria group bacterium]